MNEVPPAFWYASATEIIRAVIELLAASKSVPVGLVIGTPKS